MQVTLMKEGLLKLFQEYAGHYRCTVPGCPGQGQWQRKQAAERHAEQGHHIAALRLLDATPDPLLVQEIEDTPNETPPHPTIEGVSRSTRARYRASLLHAAHGPALESDPPDMIYDDFGGALQGMVDEPLDEPSAIVSPPQQTHLSVDDESQPSPPLPRGPLPSRRYFSRGRPVASFDNHGASEELSAASEPRLAHDKPADLQDDPNQDVNVVDDPVGYWPWRKREETLLDLLDAFPRSQFSESQIESFRLFYELCGRASLPTIDMIKNHRDVLQEIAGACPVTHEGALGNHYTMATLAVILRHEWSNPKVRPDISTYSEDAQDGEKSEFKHFEQWGSRVSSNLAGPMARSADGQDYFVSEPALACLPGRNYLSAVLPIRWFIRGGALWAKAHQLIRETSDSYFIDATATLDVPLSSFQFNILHFGYAYKRYGMPDPRHISGILRKVEEDLQPIALPLLNPWRAKAKGRRVFSTPIWTWCDDTSGNESKKWNKHNSYLFTLAGLPREQAHSMYNIHFLATSNLAHPLEMMAGIQEQIRDGQRDGIPAWDCCYKEEVLLVPWIPGLLGDNPMHSELCSHVGMGANTRMFCRVCKVERGSSSTVEDDIKRIDQFMKCGAARSKAETLEQLRAQLERTMNGTPSAVKAMSTETGVKDHFFDHFQEQLNTACQKIKAEQAKNPNMDSAEKKRVLHETLRAVREQMPDGDDIFNPTLLIDELEPSQDTPCEILHVVLLGFIKYFWRDAVSRQNAEGKQLLIVRINSLDVYALGLPPLRGETLVTYAGSLTGRDFRAIIQIAPAILYDRLPKEAYEAWLALARLVPVVFQPSIKDLDAYLRELNEHIDDFLACTALWTPQWFNKPKFHIILHLPDHVRRFGPPILYATESFESYNAVIRLRSVHSPRHAPSADIGRSFSHMHAVRHLVSGGAVFLRSKDSENSELQEPYYAGAKVQALLDNSRLVSLLGMGNLAKTTSSLRFETFKDRQPAPWEATDAALEHVSAPQHLTSSRALIQCRGITLANGDRTRINDFVLYKTRGLIKFGQVREILIDRAHSRSPGVLIHPHVVGEVSLPLRFAQVVADGSAQKELHPLASIICAVHVVHNCATAGCVPSKTRQQKQERHIVGTTWEVRHEPGNLLLNHAQMRNRVYLREILPTVRYPSLPREEIVRRAAMRRQVLEAPGESTENAVDAVGNTFVGKTAPKKKSKKRTREEEVAIDASAGAKRSRTRASRGRGARPSGEGAAAAATPGLAAATPRLPQPPAFAPPFGLPLYPPYPPASTIPGSYYVHPQPGPPPGPQMTLWNAPHPSTLMHPYLEPPPLPPPSMFAGLPMDTHLLANQALRGPAGDGLGL